MQMSTRGLDCSLWETAGMCVSGGGAIEEETLTESIDP